MPTYVCTTSTGRLNSTQKQEVVQRITQIHAKEGGNVPEYLVQVIFNEVAPGNWFINKREVPGDQVWIRGDIRMGRSDEQKRKMCERMTAEFSEVTSIDASYVWVYICDVEKASEFGSVLPKPGEEGKWVAGLGKEVRDRYGLY